jgi:TPR repeat protein
MGSVFLFGVHVGRSRIDAERRSAAIPDAQVSQPVSAPASVPASSLASDAPSGTTESAADSSQATSYPTVERPAPTAATSIPSAAITDPNAALVNTSKTDDTPANSLQGPGDRGLSAKTPDPRVEQAFEAGKSDLAAALAYLRGTNGVRDSSKAAHLLWAAVANDNATAEVVLADLYLRGDGVAKSCEQGRVLLLAASKSGDPRAKAKLGELNTNGCQ